MADDPIDRDALRRLLEVIGGEIEDLRELVDDFLASAPDLVRAMRSAVVEDDVESLRRAAHTLKGNARDFGAVRLAAASEALERSCKRREPPEDPDAAVDALAGETETARTALAALDLAALAT